MAQRSSSTVTGSAGQPVIACTLAGGPDALADRVGEWRAVVGRAVAREATADGVALVYAHDEADAVELARLAAAEFACCSFFSFTLTVSPEGMRFTVGAPPEAQDAVAAVFGRG